MLPGHLRGSQIAASPTKPRMSTRGPDDSGVAPAFDAGRRVENGEARLAEVHQHSLVHSDEQGPPSARLRFHILNGDPVLAWLLAGDNGNPMQATQVGQNELALLRVRHGDCN